MLTWKDRSSYSKGVSRQVPTTWHAEFGETRITVHKYVGCGDEWYLTCVPLGFRQESLHTTDLEEAKEKAIGLVRASLEKRIEHDQRLLEELSPPT